MPLLSANTPVLFNLTGSIGPVNYFTAPVAGLYLTGFAVQIVSTDGTGTISANQTGPQTSTTNWNSITAIPVTQDGSSPNRILWLNAGQSFAVTVTVAGVTGTVFNLLLNVIRLL